MRLGSFIKNSRGYSAAELMVAVGVAAIVTLGVAHMIVTFNQEVTSVSETLDFDEEAFRLQYFFSLPLRTAVNIKPSGGTSINGYAVPASGVNAYQGFLQDTFDSAGSNNDNTITNAVLIGAHDTSVLTGGLSYSKFQGFGIFFQQPSPTTFGVLYMASVATGNIAPRRSGTFATNITHLKIENVMNDSSGFVRSFTAHVWLRYPTNASNLNISWCPAANPCNGAGAGGAYKEIERYFVINLPNNFNPGAVAQQLPMGRIYFLGRGN